MSGNLRKMNIGVLGVLLVLITQLAGCSSNLGGFGVPSGVTPSGTILDLSAIDGTTGVDPRTNNFRYTFSSAVDTSSVTTSTFYMVQALTGDVSAPVKSAIDTATCDVSRAIAASINCYTENNCIVAPSSTLSYNTAYTACLTTGIRYANGGVFGGASFSFTTAALTADAGDTQDVDVSSTVTLDGSGSVGPAGSTLTYAWTQTSGTAVTLSDATAMQPTFTAGNELQDYVFQLVVSDGTSTSAPSAVRVRVWIDADNSLFVDASSASETHNGSMDNPYLTISEAVAASTNSADVYVAAGSYSDNVQLVEGASIYGGFEATNWTRDISTNTTTLNPSAASPTLKVAHTATITAATIIDGMTITGPTEEGDDLAETIYMTNGSALTITNNTISGGSSNTSGCIVVSCGNPEDGGCGEGLVISNNTITIGLSESSVSMGIAVNGDCTALISDNTILGSDSASFTAPDGIRLISATESSIGSCDVTITGNTLTLGAVTTTTGSSDKGIDLDDDTIATITGNTITGSDSPTYSVDTGVRMIDLNGTSSATIEDNVIDAGIETSSVDSTTATMGISVGETASATISRNKINGGEGTRTGTTGMGSIGVRIYNTVAAKSTLENNVIYGGSETTTTSLASNLSAAVTVRDKSSADILNNTIYIGGNASASGRNYGVYQQVDSGKTVNVVNNIFVQNDSAATQTVLYNNHATSKRYTTVYNNDFPTSCTSCYRQSSTDYNYTNMLTQLLSIASSNIQSDPLIDGGDVWDNYLLTATSPCIDTGCGPTCGTAISVTIPTVDYDDNPRPEEGATTDIGASQYQ